MIRGNLIFSSKIITMFECIITAYMLSRAGVIRTVCGVEIRNVTYEDINEFMEVQLGYLIDVRTSKEVQETGSLPTALNIPLNELPNAFNQSYSDFERLYEREKPGPHTKIIFYSNSGKRSEEAASLARAMGYSDPCNYPGGWRNWEKHVREDELAMNRSDDWN